MTAPEMEKQWTVEFHPDFASEVLRFSETVRFEIYSSVGLLRKMGPQLGRPHVDTLKGSKHSNMKELRFRADSGVWRVAGGDKSGVPQVKFYRNLIEIADRRFHQHQLAIAAKKEKH